MTIVSTDRSPTSSACSFLSGAFTDWTAAEVDNSNFFEGTIDFNDPDPLVFNAAITGPTYPLNVEITPLTLPTANGGIAPLSYTLLPAPLPPGLTFTPATRTLSGMPTEEATTLLIYTVTDADTPAATAVLPFSVTVGTSSGGGPTEMITLTPTSVTVTEGAAATYTAALSLAPLADVLVAISDDNPDVTTLPVILTFTADNWETPQAVTVSARDDVDVANETATLTHTATDSSYAIATLAVTVTDDDGGIVLTPATLTLDESTTASYSVALQAQPTGPVTVSILSDNADVTIDPASLSFDEANWDSAQSVLVTASADLDAVDDTAMLTHTASGGGYDLSDTLTVSVTDLDTRGVVVTLPLEMTEMTLDEGTATYTYTVALATQPTDTVTVDINWNIITPVIRFVPRPLIFTTSNWNIPQMVTVTAGKDSNTQNETDEAEHAPSGGDYDDAPTVSVVFTIIDGDKLTFNAPFTDRTYALNQAVDSVLPAASGGIGTLFYTLTGNPGWLTFIPDTRTIIGTAPATESDATSLTYTAADGRQDSIALTFTVTVVDLPVVTISDNIEIGTPATRLTDIANSADGALTFTFTWTEAVNGV